MCCYVSQFGRLTRYTKADLKATAIRKGNVNGLNTHLNEFCQLYDAALPLGAPEDHAKVDMSIHVTDQGGRDVSCFIGILAAAKLMALAYSIANQSH